MAAEIIDGKKIAARILGTLATEVGDLSRRGVLPGLAVVLAGDDPASHIYVRKKTLACAEIGLRTFDHRLAASLIEVVIF